MGPTTRVLAALAGGLLIGSGISASGSSFLQAVAGAVEPLGTIWINAIRMTLIPLIMSLLFLSTVNFSEARMAGIAGARALMVFLAYLIGSAVFAAVTVPALFQWLPIGANAAKTLGTPIPAAALQQQAQQLPTFAQWCVDLIPTNPIRAAADGTIIPVVAFSVLFGLASLQIRCDLRDSLVRLFRAVSESMLTLVRWFIKLAPLGVFALILPLTAKMGTAALGSFGYYVIVTSCLLLAQTLLLYLITAAMGGVSATRFAKAALPAQAIALSSRSSLASLPALLEGAEKTLNSRAETVGFVLPLAVSIFKIATPVAWLAGACFIARLYSVPFGPMQAAIVLAASVLLSFGTPGIPMGGLVLLAPVFSSAGLPIEGIGILMALNLVPDTFETILNVTADIGAAAVLSRQSERVEGAPAPDPSR